MATDWIPLQSFGARLNVGPNDSDHFPLLDPDQWDDVAEMVGRVDTSSHKLKWLRIVGQYDLRFVSSFVTPQEAAFSGFLPAVTWCVWPGMVDSAGVAREAGDPTAADGNNQRMWAIKRQMPRRYDEAPFIDLVHPYWCMLDIRPKQWTEGMLCPMLSIVNPFLQTAGEDPNIEFIHYWRAFVAFS